MSSSTGSGESNDVSEGEIVKGISGSGDAERDSKSRSDVVSAIMDMCMLCMWWLDGRVLSSCILRRVDGRCRQVMMV
jgi:hypothetical protein